MHLIRNQTKRLQPRKYRGNKSEADESTIINSPLVILLDFCCSCLAGCMLKIIYSGYAREFYYCISVLCLNPADPD